MFSRHNSRTGSYAYAPSVTKKIKFWQYGSVFPP
jgi:hypothetical protein